MGTFQDLMLRRQVACFYTVPNTVSKQILSPVPLHKTCSLVCSVGGALAMTANTRCGLFCPGIPLQDGALIAYKVLNSCLSKFSAIATIVLP